MFYSSSTGGFYHPSSRAKYEKNGNWPADAREIPDALYTEIQNRPANKIVVTDANGLPALADPAAPTNEQLSALVRADRDALLAKCDWTVLPDAPLADEQLAVWKKYRQELRDVTAQRGFPTTVVWPVAP